MKFTTLFLIASAVLALPTGEKAENIGQLAKKDAARANGFWYPTGNGIDNNNDDHWSGNDDNQVPEINNSEQNQIDSEPNQNQNQNNSQQNQNISEQNQNQNISEQNQNQNNSQQNQNESPLKNQKDNKGNPCTSYFYKEVKEVPEECMKSVFCRRRIASKFGCGDISYSEDWTKEKLIKEGISAHCADDVICKPEDYYTA